MNLFEVFATIGLKDSGFNAGLDRAKNAAATALKGITTAVTAASATVYSLGAAAAKIGMDFEAGMSKVAAISGASAEDMERLGEKAKEMGAKTKFSASESAAAFEYMAMAGWKTEEMLGGIEGIMSLAAASGEDLALTSDIVTDALTAFGMTAQDSGRFADLLAAASSNANTNVAMMGETFKYVAPVAGAFGFSAEDTALAIGLMANSGIKASQAGTSLRAALSSLAKPTDDVYDAMQKFGISLTNADGSMKSLDGLMNDLRHSLGSLTEAQQVEAAATLFGREAMSGMLAIVNAAPEEYEKLTKAIYESEGASARMAATMGNNLSGAITILKSGLEGLAIQFYEYIDKPLKDVTKKAQGYVSRLSEAFSNEGLSGAVNQLGAVIADVATGIAEQAPAFVQAGVDLISGFSKAIIDKLPVILESGKKVASTLIRGIGDIVPLLSPATRALGALVDNIEAVVRVAAPFATAFATFKVAMEVSDAIKKTNAAMSAATSILSKYSFAQEILTKTTFAQVLADEMHSKALSVSSVLYGVLAGKIDLMTAATALATKAQLALSAAVAAHPFAAAVVAVAGLAAGLMALEKYLYKDATAAKKLAAVNKNLKEATEKLNDAVSQSAEAYNDKIKSIEAETAVSKSLAEKISDLSAVENKSTEQKKQLAAYVDSLNASMEGLNLQYDAENDRLSMTEENIYKLIAAREDEARSVAAQERQIEVAKERFKVEEQLVELQAERSRLEAEMEGIHYSSTRTINGYTNAIGELTAQEKELEAQKTTLSEAFDYYTGVVVDSTLAANDATAALDETTAAAERQTAIMEASAEAQIIAMEKLAEEYLEYEKQATNMFSTLSDKSEISISEMTANLKENQRVISEWAENIAELAERGVDDGLLETLRAAGPESAGYVANMVNAADEELLVLSDVFANGGEVAVEALATALGLDTSVIREAETLADTTADTLENALRAADFYSMGLKVANDFADGLSNGVAKAETAARRLSQTVSRAASVTASVTAPTVSALQIPGFASGGLIKPNDPFLAVLGDNAREQEIVSPVPTMKQAVKEAIKEAMPLYSNDAPSIVIQNMNVRNDDDIQKIARELYLLQERRRRGMTVLA